jgi:hypothetical protein
MQESKQNKNRKATLIGVFVGFGLYALINHFVYPYFNDKPVQDSDTTRTENTIEKAVTPAVETTPEENSSEIPANGSYIFDVAFAEHQGKSMGVKVKVEIESGNIKVLLEEPGNLEFSAKGEVLDQGELVLHKTGVWIISSNPEDKNLDEVGGCTDGPSIIDFKEKKYWMC